MRKRLGIWAYSTLFAIMGVSACVPMEQDETRYATICDDVKEPDCAPDSVVVVE